MRVPSRQANWRRIRFGYEINEEWRQRLRYIVRRDEIAEVDDDASFFIRNKKENPRHL